MVKKHKKTDAQTVFDYRRNSDRFFTHFAAHYRQRDRKQVGIRCEVDIVLRNGKSVDSGKASIENVSANGALLSNFKLEKSVLPAKPFRIRLRMLSKEFQGITITCLPMRLEVDDGFGIGNLAGFHGVADFLKRKLSYFDIFVFRIDSAAAGNSFCIGYFGKVKENTFR